MPRFTPRPLLAAIVGVVALTLGACSARGGGRSRPPDAATYVEVRNQNWQDQNVYVLRSSQRVRLGTVTGGSTQKLRIPSSLLFGATPLSFLADPIGSSRQAISMEITVSPGETVTLTIPPR